MQNLVYEWVDFFQNFPKFEPKSYRKIGRFCLKFGAKLILLVYKWVTYSWKIGICIHVVGLLLNSAMVHPYQNQTWVPPGSDCSKILSQQGSEEELKKKKEEEEEEKKRRKKEKKNSWKQLELGYFWTWNHSMNSWSVGTTPWWQLLR